MGALLARESDQNVKLWAVWVIAVAAACSSFHHQWSWPGQVLLRTPEAFAILYAAMTVLVGIAAFWGKNYCSACDSKSIPGGC
jgi:hypothetical protein